MFLQRERTDTNVFVLKKYLAVKKKNLIVISIFQEIIRILYTFLADILTNIPLHIQYSAFLKIPRFFHLFPNKILRFLSG